MLKKILQVLTLGGYLSLLVYLVFRNTSAEFIFFANDSATDLLVARLMDQHEYALLGPPSHTGGRHPGPLYYWYVFIIAKLVAFDPRLVSLVMSATKFLALGILAFICAALVERRARFWAMLGVVISFCAIPYVSIFRTHWQSNFLPISSSIALLGTYAVLKHGVLCFPLYVLALSILFQSHLSSTPVIAGLVLGVLAYFCVTFSERKQECHGGTFKKPLFWIPILLVLVLWAPVLWHELNYKSNFLGLFNLHYAHKTTTGAGVYAASVLGLNFFQKFSFGGMFAEPFGSLQAVGALAVFLVFVFLFVNSERTTRWFLVTVLASLVLSVVALSKFRAPLYPHYLNSSICIPVLFTAFIIAQVSLSMRVGRPLVQRVSAFVVLAFSLFSFSRILEPHKFTRKEGSFFDFNSLAHSQELAGVIRKKEPELWDTTKIFALLGAEHSLNSYYFLLNSKLYPNMEYAEFFQELPSFHKKVRSKRAFVVFCPASYRRERVKMTKHLRKKWKITEEFVPSCFACDRCALMSLSRKKSVTSGAQA